MRAPRTAESAKGPPKRYIIYFFQGFAKEDCRRVFRGLWPDAAPARGAASRSSLAGLGERGKNGSGIVGRDVADLGELGIELRDHVAHDAGLGRVVKPVDELGRKRLEVRSERRRVGKEGSGR